MFMYKRLRRFKTTAKIASMQNIQQYEVRTMINFSKLSRLESQEHVYACTFFISRFIFTI